MQFGVCMFPADFAMDPVELGRAAEERGFESLFFPEHTHIPVKRETPWPQGDKLPSEYARIMDPFIALAAVASVTSRIKLGTGICLVIQHDPIVLAKEVASIDQVSHGRFLFGVGAGWLREEIANHGVDPRKRWRVFDERMQAMQTIWSSDEASFHGSFVNFDAIWSWPKPVQQPHPPLLMGGDYGAAMDRVVQYADEWMPHPERGEAPLKERVVEFWQRCESAGRPRLPVTVYGSAVDARRVEEYERSGVTRCVFRLPPAAAGEVLPVLDKAAALARDYSN